MNRAELHTIVDLLRAMAQLELALSRLYNVCADAMPEDREFWEGLVRQERSHAESIYTMYQLIHAKPERFEMGRNFNKKAIETYRQGIEKNIERIKKGELTPEKILIIARDIENSILENKIAEVVQTKDVEYCTLVNEIIADTSSHKNAIIQKMREIG